MTERPDLERLRRGVQSSVEAAECARYIDQLEARVCTGCQKSVAEWELLDKIASAAERMIDAGQPETHMVAYHDLHQLVEELDTLRGSVGR